MVANIRGQTPTQETALSIPKKIPAAAVAVTIAAAPPPPPANAMGNPKASTDDGKYGFTRRITPPVGFSSGSHNELSEAECDLEIRNRNKEVAKAASGAILGHGRSQFRSYAAEKDNKDYSIKV